MTPYMDSGPGRNFAWEIEYERNEDKATCWIVAAPFQAADEYLVIHATRGNGNDGGVITIALSKTPLYDVYAAETFRLMHRNSPQGDGFADETDAA